MVGKFLCTFLLGNLFFGWIYAQEPKLVRIGPEAQFLLAGELNSSYDFLLGGRGTYDISQFKRLKVFASIGIFGDVGSAQSNLVSADVQVGSSLKLGKRFQIIGSLGPTYITERQSIQLIERRKDWQENTFGLSAKIGLDYHISQRLTLNASFNQTNLLASSVGLGMNYIIKRN